jgi:hypothetical protein
LKACREHNLSPFPAKSLLIARFSPRHGCAWGLFDRDGKKDEIGTFNLLTPSVVMRAREEIKTGTSISLNWGLDRLNEITFGRSILKHEKVDWRTKPGFDFYSYDDEVSFNTQTGGKDHEPSSNLCAAQAFVLTKITGSQWDGLRE